MFLGFPSCYANFLLQLFLYPTLVLHFEKEYQVTSKDLILEIVRTCLPLFFNFIFLLFFKDGMSFLFICMLTDEYVTTVICLLLLLSSRPWQREIHLTSNGKRGRVATAALSLCGWKRDRLCSVMDKL